MGTQHPVWSWNGSMEIPTFIPSILITDGHYVLGHKGQDCWCTYNREHPDEPSPFHCGICHSYVTAGWIHFLADCTHELAGMTVNLPEWEDV
jgi:hypothetical protein